MKKLRSLVLGIALLFMTGTAMAQQTLCYYPSVCARIWCYVTTPAIAVTLTDQQISDFSWYYVTFCWA